MLFIRGGFTTGVLSAGGAFAGAVAGGRCVCGTGFGGLPDGTALVLTGAVELAATTGESSPRMSTGAAAAALGVGFASPGGPLADVGGVRFASGLGFGGPAGAAFASPLLSPSPVRGVIGGFTAAALGGAVDGGAPVGCGFAGGAEDGGPIEGVAAVGGADDGGPIAFAWPFGGVLPWLVLHPVEPRTEVEQLLVSSRQKHSGLLRLEEDHLAAAMRIWSGMPLLPSLQPLAEGLKVAVAPSSSWSDLHLVRPG